MTVLDEALADVAWLAEPMPDGRLPMSVSEIRVEATRLHPLLFATTYLPHHLRSEATGDEITLSAVHAEWSAYAASWAELEGGDREHRDAFVAPRSMGKSTWFFLILPMWAAAHGHRRFVAAFADSARQAEEHLSTFRHELDTNAAIRRDFPKLVNPRLRGRGTTAGDNKAMYQAESGFVFAARGADSSALGLKVGRQRPDLIILDDLEPDESSYSAALADKRLTTLQDAILPLNERAVVCLVGTVTMVGSIVHQVVEAHTRPGDTSAWVREQNFIVHYHPGIVALDDGTEASVWPERWPLDYLQSIRHTRAFAKNFMNNPMGRDSAYWTLGTFRRGELALTHMLLSIDPAVTVKESSDPTGFAVVGYSRPLNQCRVEHGESARLTPAGVRDHVIKLLDRFPEVGLVLVETNQGGDLWRDALHSLPVKVVTIHQTLAKELRAARALNHYERGRVLHAEGLHRAEAEMVSFPQGAHDDIVDAVGSGLAYFLDRAKRRASGVSAVADYA